MKKLKHSGTLEFRQAPATKFVGNLNKLYWIHLFNDTHKQTLGAGIRLVLSAYYKGCTQLLVLSIQEHP